MPVLNFYNRRYLVPKSFNLNEDQLLGLIGNPVQALHAGVDMDLYKSAHDSINKSVLDKAKALAAL